MLEKVCAAGSAAGPLATGASAALTGVELNLAGFQLLRFDAQRVAVHNVLCAERLRRVVGGDSAPRARLHVARQHVVREQSDHCGSAHSRARATVCWPAKQLDAVLLAKRARRRAGGCVRGRPRLDVPIGAKWPRRA